MVCPRGASAGSDETFIRSDETFIDETFIDETFIGSDETFIDETFIDETFIEKDQGSGAADFYGQPKTLKTLEENNVLRQLKFPDTMEFLLNSVKIRNLHNEGLA